MAAPDPSYFVTASNRINNSSLTTTQTFWRSPPPSHLDEFLRRTDCCYGIGKGEMVRTAEVAGRSVGRSVGTTRRRPTARAARQIMLYVCGSGAAGAAAATPGCSVAPRERRGPENEVRPCACELRTSEACARAECYPHSPLFFSLVDGTTVSAMRRGTFSAMPCRQSWASTYGLWLSGTLSLSEPKAPVRVFQGVGKSSSLIPIDSETAEQIWVKLSGFIKYMVESVLAKEFC